MLQHRIDDNYPDYCREKKKITSSEEKAIPAAEGSINMHKQIFVQHSAINIFSSSQCDLKQCNRFQY